MSRSKIFLLIVALFALAFYASAQLPSDTGKYFFLYKGKGSLKDKPLKVWCFSPSTKTDSLPIVIMLHGARRNASAYLDDWIETAKLFHCIVIAPEFSSQDYPRVDKYNLGNVYDPKSKKFLAEPDWTFSVIEPLFDFVKEKTKSVQTGYYLAGHSAGAQFVHRFLFFKPENRVIRAMISNAGWYTMPDDKLAFPFGVKDSPVDSAHLNKVFSKSVFMVLGEADTDTESPDFNKGPEYEVQGSNRFERGKNFYAYCENKAREIGSRFNWKLASVPGIGHSNREVSKYGAALLFMNLH